MASQEFQFISPPEAPTFRPTWEEFQDALQYINKIRPVAEQYGICKIIPPPDWQPPFAVDVDNFKFTPRIQRLNELEAHTRIKLNFLDQIAKFWELQGSSLKIPVVEKKALDLYSLHKKVQDAGGGEAVARARGWNKIAFSLGFASHKNLGTQLKQIYERILQPFDIFNRSKEVPLGGDKNCTDNDPDFVAEPKDYKPHQIPSRMAGKIPENEKNGRRSRRYHATEGEDDEDCSSNAKELQRLQFKGPGPKNADMDKDTKNKGRNRRNIFYDHDPLAKYICLNCGRGDAEEHMLLCDGCDDSYHTFCLMPSLTEIPKGDWRCPKCVAVEVSKPLEAFGFEQAQKEYNLQSFGEMADKFKQDYFNMPVHLVPTAMAEREFWRIVSSIDEDVTVEYGADLHTMDHGSGFPTHHSSNLMPADQVYANDSWNLNNLPVQEGSVLAHIGCDISGMKVPWMYVGMCFSTFCWHNEDHWSYSINYLHWGEPKTWYGVPGGEAEKFEACMKSAAPELFESQPDLLHQLVTIMNPNILMRDDVPIVRCDQHAGEFMITFPRSYHAGFNQGYNFAEAVNFAPSDWLAIGRECIDHYSKLKRYCVFSHDELVCKMASAPDSLELTVAAATYQDLLKMVDGEKRQRKALLQWGVKAAEREAFELLPDDERQCDFCKTTCFLSAVTCSCSPAKLVCLRHHKNLCSCLAAQHVLRYRYTLDELPPMLQQLKQRAESFDHWAAEVKRALEAKLPEDKLDLEDLRALVTTAEERRFPDNELLGALLAAVAEADKCAAVAAHLNAKKVRTRTRGSGDPKSRLTLDELQLFYDQICSLACTVKESEGVKNILDTVIAYQCKAAAALVESDKWMMEYKMREESDEDTTVSADQEDGTRKTKRKKRQAADQQDAGKAGQVEAMDVDDDTIKDEKEGIKQENEKDLKVDKKEEEEEEGDAKNQDGDEQIHSEELSALLETGLELDIELPELARLRCRLQKVQWLEEVQDMLECESSVTAEAVRALLSKAHQLPPHRLVERTRSALQQLCSDIEEYDARAAALLASKRCTLLEAEQMVQEASHVRAHLPSLWSLRDFAKKAREWKARAAAICSKCRPPNHSVSDPTPDNGAGSDCSAEGTAVTNGTTLQSNGVHTTPNANTTPQSSLAEHAASPAPMLEMVESLVHRARPIPLLLPELRLLEGEATAAHVWLEKTSKIFLKKNSTYSLIEVLVPRTEVGVVGSNKRKRFKKDELSSVQQAAVLLEISAQHAADPAYLLRAYKDCEEREVKAMRAVRCHRRSQRQDVGVVEETVCTCHKPPSPDMVICALCSHAYHPGCVPLSSCRSLPSLSAPWCSAVSSSSSFLCPSCHRSCRPKMENILTLLLQLQKIRVRFCEAIALQCLTERAMAWQDRAQSLLQDPVLTAASTSLQRALTLLTPPISATDKGDNKSETLWSTNLGLSSPTSAQRNSPSAHPGPVTPRMVTSVLSTLVESTDAPFLDINEHTRKDMLEMVLEGELLEVTMEETTTLWQLLQLAVMPVSAASEVILQLAGMNNANYDQPQQTSCSNKKRKSHEIEMKSNKNMNKSPKRAKVAGGGASNSSSTRDSVPTSNLAKNTDLNNDSSSNNGNISSNNCRLTAAGNNKSSTGEDVPRKSIKKKSNSMSRLPEGRKKEAGSVGAGCIVKKKRPLVSSLSSGNIMNKSQTMKSPLPPAPPKKPTVTPSKPSKAVPGPASKKKPVTAATSSSSSTSSSDDEDVCAAARCKIPVGSAVDWVQCDECNGWFHYVCVGLKHTDLREDEDYICVICRGANPSRAKASATASRC
ncbi:JmjN domain [Trinorchestia longiramus]|nr:JmjN domain [Trinorchestia longiramus]